MVTNFLYTQLLSRLTSTCQMQAMAAPVRIAASFLLYVAVTQTLGNFRGPHCKILLSSKTAFRWLLLH